MGNLEKADQFASKKNQFFIKKRSNNPLRE
jgi:hypothetical protein